MKYWMLSLIFLIGCTTSDEETVRRQNRIREPVTRHHDEKLFP